VVVETLYEGMRSVTLSNGLRILVEEVPQSRSVSVSVWVNAGSRDDPAEFPGLAHLVEHLLFKGTETRTGLGVSQEIDAVGGFLDAATGKESTFVYADVPADGLSTATELLLDVVLHPSLAADKLELERAVVLEEIRGYDDDPEQRAFDQFVRGVWPGDHPLSRNVLGTRRAIESVLRSDVAAFHARVYRPANLVIAAAGAMDVERLFADVERLTGGDGRAAAPVPLRVPPRFQPARNHYVQPTGQTHVYLALPGPLSDDPDRFPLEVANAVLGDGTSSRLFCAIREDRGLAYAVHSTISRYSDTGLWMAYAGVAPATADAVADLLLAEFDRLRSEPIPEDEIGLAKARIRGSFILGLESNANRAMRLGTAAINGREILSPEQILAKLAAVDIDSVHAAVERFVRLDEAHLATIGPEA
jgi:predicted Zn-dependent peptidase